jgi:hypothetical protein
MDDEAVTRYTQQLANQHPYNTQEERDAAAAHFIDTGRHATLAPSQEERDRERRRRERSDRERTEERRDRDREREHTNERRRSGR